MDSPQFSCLPLSRISKDRYWSLHQDLNWYPGDELITSIKQYGVLHPPIIQQCDGDEIKLVSGSNRIEALRILGYQNCTCLKIDKTLSDNEIICLVAQDQVQAGPLSPIESARLMKLAQDSGGVDLVNRIVPFLSEKNRTIIDRLTSLLACELPVRAAIHHGSVSTRAGLEMLVMVSTDRLFLTDLFVRLMIGANKQIRIIDLARILSVQCSMPIKDLISAHFSYCLEGAASENKPQCTTRLLNDLYHASHPRFFEAQQDFEHRVAALHLPTYCTVSPSVSFESDRVTMTIEFRTLSDLEEQWPAWRNHIIKSHS